MSDSLIIADTSVLITLERINKLDLLHFLFTEIYITTIVNKEYGIPLPDWVHIKDPKFHQHVNLSNLDKGEASSINLALENRDSLLIIDEKKGRIVAKSLDINIIGLIGIIIKAKEMKYLNSVSKVLIELEHADFRISDSLKMTMLEIANEK